MFFRKALKAWLGGIELGSWGVLLKEAWRLDELGRTGDGMICRGLSDGSEVKFCWKFKTQMRQIRGLGMGKQEVVAIFQPR